MSMASYDRPAAFRIGRVFGDSFGVLGRNFGLSFGLALIFSGIPTFLLQLWATNVATSVALDPSQDISTGVLLSIIGGLVSFVLSALLQAALVRGAVEDLSGNRPSFGDCLRTAIAVFLPSIGITLLIGLIAMVIVFVPTFLFGMVLGPSGAFVMFLAFIPVAMLILRWSAAVPALVQERLGVWGSMSRSADLTSGSRWRLLGLYIILVVVMIVLQLLIGIALAMAFSVTESSMAVVLVSAMGSALSFMLLSVAMAVSYVELRYVKEGTDVKELAEIFA